jgi:hypothetical protein
MNDEWVYLGTLGAGTDEVYGQYQHAPCGTVLEILQGHMARICPKCHAKEWADMQARGWGVGRSPSQKAAASPSTVTDLAWYSAISVFWSSLLKLATVEKS